MTIAVDVDGVLADFVGNVCKSLGLSYDSINCDIRKHIDDQNKYEKLVSSHEFHYELPMCKGAEHLISELLAYDDYVIATTVIDIDWATVCWKSYRADWIKRIGLDPEKVVFMSPKQKTLLNVDLIIEDNEWTATNWMEKQKKRSALLVGRPWNSGKLTVEQCAKAVKYQRILRDG